MHKHWNEDRRRQCPCHGCPSYTICEEQKKVCEEFRFYVTGIKTHAVPEHYPSHKEYEIMLEERTGTNS